MTSARRGGQWFPNGAAFSFSTVHRRSSTRLVLDTPTRSPLPFFTIFVWGLGGGETDEGKGLGMQAEGRLEGEGGIQESGVEDKMARWADNRWLFETSSAFVVRIITKNIAKQTGEIQK